MDEVTVKISTPYDDKGAKQAIRDEEKLNQQARENRLTRRFQREGGLDETTARQKARLIIDGHAANTAARQQAAEQKRFAEEYTRDWQKAINEEVAQKKAAAAIIQKQSSEAAAAEKARSEEAWKRTQQTRGLTDYDRELHVGELRAKGKHKEAAEAEKALFIEKHREELMRKYGLAQEEALVRAQRAHAVMQAGGGHGGNLGNWRMAGEFGDMIFGQGQVMRAMQAGRMLHMMEALGIGGGAALGIAAAAAPLVGYAGYKGAQLGEMQKNLAFSNKLGEERAADRLSKQFLQAGGSEEEASSKWKSEFEALNALQEHRRTLVSQAKNSWAGTILGQKFVTQGVGWYKPQSARDISETDAEIERTQEQLRRSVDEARARYAEVGEKRVAASEARANGNPEEASRLETEAAVNEERRRMQKLQGLPGATISDADVQRAVEAKRKEMEESGYASFSRLGGNEIIGAQEARTQGLDEEARKLEETSMWWKKYDEVLNQVGRAHADVAIRAANAELAEQQRVLKVAQNIHAEQVSAQEALNHGNSPAAAQFSKQAAMDQERERLKSLHLSSGEIDRAMKAFQGQLEGKGEEAKFMREGGMDRIEATEARNRGDMKGARQHERMANWWSTYNRVLQSMGGEANPDAFAVAKRAADNEMYKEKVQEAMKMGGAINARAGVGEAIRVATMAAHYAGIQVNDGTASAVKDLHHMVRTQGQQALDVAWREKFPARPYR